MDPEKAAGKIHGNGGKSTYELRKGIDEADQLPHFEAHHVAPEELLNDPKLKQFFDDIQFNPQDGKVNGAMLPKQKLANAEEYRKFLEDLKYDLKKIDDAVAKFDPKKWENATPHNGSHPQYTADMTAQANRLRNQFDDLVEDYVSQGLPKDIAIQRAKGVIEPQWQKILNDTKAGLLDGSVILNP
jgi:hypothetical protein